MAPRESSCRPGVIKYGPVWVFIICHEYKRKYPQLLIYVINLAAYGLLVA